MNHCLKISGILASAVGAMAMAEVQTFELEATQSAGMYATGCCSISYAGGFNSSSLSTRNCQSVYMSCVGSKRAAMWRFDLSELPDEGTPLTLHFSGTRTYSDMTGSGFISLMTDVDNLNSTVGMQLWSSGDYRANINWNYGTNFTFSLTSALNSGLLQETDSVALMVYGSTTSGITIPNSGASAPKLRVVMNMPDAPPCDVDLNGDGVVDATDLGIFLAYWGPKPHAGDFNNDGMADAADLGIMLAAWGQCP